MFHADFDLSDFIYIYQFKKNHKLAMEVFYDKRNKNIQGRYHIL